MGPLLFDLKDIGWVDFDKEITLEEVGPVAKFKISRMDPEFEAKAELAKLFQNPEFISVSRSAKKKLEALLDHESTYYKQYKSLIEAKMAPPLPSQEIIEKIASDSFQQIVDDIVNNIESPKGEDPDFNDVPEDFWELMKISFSMTFVDQHKTEKIKKYLLEKDSWGEQFKKLAASPQELEKVIQEDITFKQKAGFYFQNAILEIELTLADKEFNEKLSHCQKDLLLWPEMFRDPVFKKQYSLLSREGIAPGIPAQILEILEMPAIREAIKNIKENPTEWKKYLEDENVKKGYAALVRANFLLEPEIGNILAEEGFKKRFDSIYRHKPEAVDK